VVNDVSFKVHAGKIVGIYGLMGAGRTELFECMLGTERNYLGKLWLDSKPVPQRLSTADRPHGHEPGAGRPQTHRIFPGSSVASNLTIASLWRRLQRGLTISQKDEQAVVATDWQSVDQSLT
jgi:erythritol transport system ATP-binding protein